MAKISYTATAVKAAFDRRIADMMNKPATKAENFDLMARCCDYMAGAYFLDTAKAGKVNLGFIDGSNGCKPMAIYAVKRLVDMVRLAEAGFDVAIGATDQTRYVREMIVSLNNSRLTGKQFSRLDQRATGSKGRGDTATGYADGVLTDGLKVSGRIMAGGTTATQTTNTLATFKVLNMADDNGQRGGAFRWFAKPESELLARYADQIANLIAREQGLKRA